LLVFFLSLSLSQVFVSRKEEIFFSVRLKNNFFVKSVYKFMNELIDKEGLINEINLFIKEKT